MSQTKVAQFVIMRNSLIVAVGASKEDLKDQLEYQRKLFPEAKSYIFQRSAKEMTKVED